MRTPSFLGRGPLVMVLFGVALLGCPKKGGGGTDAAATTASASPVTSSVTLAPLESEETATATAPSALPPLVTAKPGSPTAKPVLTAIPAPSATASAKPATAAAQAQLKNCCAAIRKQAKQNAAQAAQLNQAAAVCDGLVAAMAGAPSMPQLDPVKALLQGTTLPPVCQGL
jgi:hypothetical protein